MLKVKQVVFDGQRYIVCENPCQARKEAREREAIVFDLKEKIKQGPKALVGNKGYRKFLKVAKGAVKIDEDRIAFEARFDGKRVLQTNTDLSAEQVALKYKQLWQVERIFEIFMRFSVLFLKEFKKTTVKDQSDSMCPMRRPAAGNSGDVSFLQRRFQGRVSCPEYRRF